jgi:hypothetical protein
MIPFRPHDGLRFWSGFPFASGTKGLRDRPSRAGCIVFMQSSYSQFHTFGDLKSALANFHCGPVCLTYLALVKLSGTPSLLRVPSHEQRRYIFA